MRGKWNASITTQDVELPLTVLFDEAKWLPAAFSVADFNRRRIAFDSFVAWLDWVLRAP
jgi:hypothetical protein